MLTDGVASTPRLNINTPRVLADGVACPISNLERGKEQEEGGGHTPGGGTRAAPKPELYTLNPNPVTQVLLNSNVCAILLHHARKSLSFDSGTLIIYKLSLDNLLHRTIFISNIKVNV